ncbi:MAG: TIM barrel protein [Candidatus Parvarchaeota archaeon]|nr:TIM barrel protein [Candidatus Parvarchaeota archaeon]
MTDYQIDNKFNDAFRQQALGISIGERNQLAEFSRLLRTGAKMVEIDLASLYGYTGEGTPANRITRTERESIGNLAKTNDMDLSVHAPWSINFSGINPDPRSLKKEEEYQEQMRNEMKSAINFADDVSKRMGREHMPIIFHAASDHLGNPDPNKRLSVYDNEEEKAMSVGRERIAMVPGDFKRVYGEETYNKLKFGITPTEDGKGMTLSPSAALEFYKDQTRMDLNQKRVSLEVSKRNLEMQKMDLANELAMASANGELQKIDELSKRKTTFDQMEKDLNVQRELLDNAIGRIETRFSRFDEKAPMLAAEGIKDAALLSLKTKTQPMILVENTMTPDMSLSRPRDVAEAVARARQLFVEEEVKQGMHESDARKLSEDMIGVNLDVGHLNIFKSYGLKDTDITKMLTEGNKVKDEHGNTIFMPNISEFVKRYHLNDNMGDIDAHLPLGEGTTPVKEIFETLQNAGVAAPAIMEVFGGPGGIEAGMTESMQYLGTPISADMPYMSPPAYAGKPYSSLIGDYSSSAFYSSLGLRNDLFPSSGFTGLGPILGAGYMENNRGGGSFSGAPLF